MRSTTRRYSRLLLALLAAAPLLPYHLLAEDITKQYVGGISHGYSDFALEFFTGQKFNSNLLLMEGSVQTGSGNNTAMHACTSQVTPTPSKAVALTLTNIPGFPGQSQIQGANAAGVAVGTAQNGSSEDAPYLAFAATPPTGFVPASIIPATSTTWKITALDNLANTTLSEALGINATNVAVGMAYTDSFAHQYAVRWSAEGAITNLNNVDGNSSLTLTQANAINDSGQIVGETENFHAFLLDNGTATDLGSLGGGGSQAYGINNSGQIVGQSNTADSQTHAFLYANGNMTDLGTLPGGNFSQANAINPSGLVIGISNIASGAQHAVLWEANGTIHDLNAIAPNTTFVYTDATAIDSAGDIFVQAENSAKAQFGVLLVVASNSTSGSAPTISTNPGNLTVPVGAKVTFTGGATGSPTPTYQWYFGTKKITGATSSSYTIARVATTNAGNYSFVATNSLGSAISKSAILTVLTPPKITGQPKPQSATSGGNATFSVTATGTPVLDFYWQFSKTTSSYSNVTMTTVSSLTLTGVTSSNQGNYRVIVSNAAGATQPSSAAKLTVKP